MSHVGDRDKPEYRGEFESPETQLAAARAYCQLHGFQLDESGSAANADLDQSAFRRPWRKRPGLVAHLEAAKRGEVQHLIVYKLARLARNARAGLEIFEAFEAAGAGIHAVREGIDSTTPVGRLVRTILLAVAEMQAEDLSSTMEDTFRQRATQGKHHGPPPAWIRKNPDTGAYELDPERAPGFQELVRLRLRHHSHMEIVRALNRAKHPPPTARSRTWSRHAVQSALLPDSRKTMHGTSVYGVGLPNDDPRRIETPGVFPPLLSEAEIDALDRLEATARSAIPGGAGSDAAPDRNRYTVAARLLLAGLLRCSACGGRMNIGHSTGRAFYRCRRASESPEEHEGVLGAHGGLYFIAARVDEAALRGLEAILRIVLSDVALPSPAAPTASPARRNRPPDSARAVPLARSLEDITRAIDALFELLERGKLRAADFERRYEALVAEQQQLQQQLAQEDARRGQERARSALTGDKLALLSLPFDLGDEDTWQLARTLLEDLVDHAQIPVDVTDHKGLSSRKRRRWLRLRLKAPLPDGTTAVLADLHTAQYRGQFEVRREQGVVEASAIHPSPAATPAPAPPLPARKPARSA